MYSQFMMHGQKNIKLSDYVVGGCVNSQYYLEFYIQPPTT